MTRDPCFVRSRLSALQFIGIRLVFWTLLLGPFVIMWWRAGE